MDCNLSVKKVYYVKPFFIYLHVVSYPNTKPTWEKIRKQLVINKNNGTVFFLVLFDNIKAELYNIVISVYIYIVIKPNCLYNFQCKINSCSSYPYHIVCFVQMGGGGGGLYKVNYQIFEQFYLELFVCIFYIFKFACQPVIYSQTQNNTTIKYVKLYQKHLETLHLQLHSNPYLHQSLRLLIISNHYRYVESRALAI